MTAPVCLVATCEEPAGEACDLCRGCWARVPAGLQSAYRSRQRSVAGSRGRPWARQAQREFREAAERCAVAAAPETCDHAPGYGLCTTCSVLLRQQRDAIHPPDRVAP